MSRIGPHWLPLDVKPGPLTIVTRNDRCWFKWRGRWHRANRASLLDPPSTHQGWELETRGAKLTFQPSGEYRWPFSRTPNCRRSRITADVAYLVEVVPAALDR